MNYEPTEHEYGFACNFSTYDLFENLEMKGEIVDFDAFFKHKT